MSFRLLKLIGLLLFALSAQAYHVVPKLCLSFYSSNEALKTAVSLKLFKNKILEIADHPEFKKDDFDFNATGPRLRFLHPLVDHMILKTSRELELRGHTPDLAKFNIQKQKWLEDLKNDRMSYMTMLTLPSHLSTYIQSAIWKTDISDYTIKLPFVVSKSVIVRFEKQKIFPIPMFFTPDFELRTRLWALGKPMISVVKDSFYSHLDETTFEVMNNIDHDWNHAVAEVGAFAASGERPMAHEKRHAGNQALVAYADALPEVKRKIAFFFLHQLIPEGALLYSESSRKRLSVMLKDTLERYFFQKMVPTWSSLKVSKLEWIIDSLGLVNVRFETAPGRFVRFDRREDGSIYLAEGTFAEYKEYMTQLVNEFEVGMTKSLSLTGTNN